MENSSMAHGHGNHSVDISAIAKVVQQGKAIVSGDDSVVIAAIMAAIQEKRVATFYVTPAVQAAIMDQYWTSERREKAQLQVISDQEIARIKNDLDIDVSGFFNGTKCPNCGGDYGMYEFLQQGIESHGRRMVEGILSLKDVAVIRVNPVQHLVCRNCKDEIPSATLLGKPLYYQCNLGYGCCIDSEDYR
ncbi:MAG TPA: hypothetical protein VFR78_10600 [Pyrinomonadaceae bacterium]|nr:hypothetical protein [Pyrinomonadaceae bacterium]